MHKHSLVIYPSKILSSVSKPVVEFNSDLEKFVDLMYNRMLQEQGVGLAANQIGSDLSLFVVNYPKFKVYINPILVKHSNDTDSLSEGCLSLPGISHHLDRYKSIEIQYQDIYGNINLEFLEDYPARIIQHELDHLNGVLYIDRLHSLVRDMMRKKVLKIKKRGGK